MSENQKVLPPFTTSYSPNIPELLHRLGITLALSTYQAGKVIFISATDEENLVQLPRTFDNAMGLAVSENKLAIACRNELVVLSASASLAPGYPDKPDTYDTLFAPRATYFTGNLALHDLAFADQGLLAVNTLFSCLSVIDDECSFKPIWQPPFIADLAPEDRCHLNGMALQDGKVKYMSALGTTDSRQGWREHKTTGGVLLDVESSEVILEGLPMPHSPRLYDGKLYMLLSAAGELVTVDPARSTYEKINYLKGFARGMAKYDDYLFIGISKLRHKTSVFGDLPIAQESPFAGIVVLYLPMGNIVGHIRYETSVEEIYDVKVLPRIRRPGIMNTEKDTHRAALVTPETSFWAKNTPDSSVFDVTP